MGVFTTMAFEIFICRADNLDRAVYSGAGCCGDSRIGCSFRDNCRSFANEKRNRNQCRCPDSHGLRHYLLRHAVQLVAPSSGASGRQSWGRFWGWDPKENGALIMSFECGHPPLRWGGLVKQRGLMMLTVFAMCHELEAGSASTCSVSASLLRFNAVGDLLADRLVICHS